jgi:hypothetical protein
MPYGQMVAIYQPPVFAGCPPLEEVAAGRRRIWPVEGNIYAAALAVEAALAFQTTVSRDRLADRFCYTRLHPALLSFNPCRVYERFYLLFILQYCLPYGQPVPIYQPPVFAGCPPLEEVAAGRRRIGPVEGNIYAAALAVETALAFQIHGVYPT